MKSKNLNQTVKERIKKLLLSQGRLSFCESYDNTEIIGSLYDADRSIIEYLSAEATSEDSVMQDMNLKSAQTTFPL